MNRCLFCYKELNNDSSDFHPACSRKIFGKPEAPELPYSEEQMLALANQVIKSHLAVTGVQAKLSLNIEKKQTNAQNQNPTPTRFTIVGLWGAYILKPPTQQFESIPEVEDLTMHLATIAGIETVPHSLVRLTSGKLAYITKRIDRVKGAKLHMEDMCQLTERLTEDKYKGSYEQIAKTILKFSANPGLDLINFFEQVLFSFLTGNADMHLKNFSLIKKPNIGYVLAPAYDMVSSALLLKEDTEELALTLNGKKRKLNRNDFEKVMQSTQLTGSKTLDTICRKMSIAIPEWISFIKTSFLTEQMKEEYIALIGERASRLGLL